MEADSKVSVLGIVTDWLASNGFDGLYDEELCSCDLKDGLFSRCDGDLGCIPWKKSHE